ncbi:IniB N-terminal domain-containing protein [Micromonospora deserti]|uniref:Uncharacterized protein n=1 Tax=Micromonospora deserti TaxID=2070366 RepID=A0A2W2CNR5_9ACTN|nr:IniB N-terminal domain-containing protein [Micromonospora deserti]PZG01136.1 hypothetical protein C1I99_08250 [Micromonospora deserti]
MDTNQTIYANTQQTANVNTQQTINVDTQQTMNVNTQQAVNVDTQQTVNVDTQHSASLGSQQAVQVDAQQSLHDFVLNLLTNPDARSAFDLDPEGALRAAGLTDITAADVQDVVPLVVDYAPVHGLAPVTPTTTHLGVDPLLTDTTDVIGQLQQVTHQISINSTYTGADIKAGALGAIAVDPGTVTASATVLPGIGLGIGPNGLTTDLTGVHDVAHTLDADVVSAVDTTTDPLTSDLTNTATNPNTILDTTNNGLLNTPDGLLNGPLAGTTGHLDATLGSLGVNDTLGGVTGQVDTTLSGVTGTVDSLTGDTNGLTNSLTGDLTGGLTGGASGGVSGGVSGNADADASASTSGALGLTDGLL